MSTKAKEPEQDLSDLVGRHIECRLHGQRSAKVLRVTSKGTLECSFHDPIGVHYVPMTDVLGVYWRKRLMKVADFVAMKGGAS